jgi:hypothetical protein
MAKANPLRFMASTYVDRVNDAVCVELGDTVIYFSNKKVIAMYAQEALYRVDKLDSGILYKRVRHATMRHSPRKIHQMSREDLAAMVEAALMTMAAKLVDEKMGIQVE